MSFAVNKAKYDIKIKVQFDLNGGTSISETEKTYIICSKYESFPIATKTGLTLAGWFTDPIDGRKITEDDIVDYRITKLYAHFITMSNFTSFEVTTSSSYKKFGIYSTTLKSTSSSQFIDWGDDTIEEVSGNINLKVHEYANVGTYIVKVSDDITSIAISYDNSAWHQASSQVYYTLKKILHYSTSLTTIPSHAYIHCYNMTSISGIGDSNITSIPTYCFYNCYNLTSLNGLSNITSIGTYCFYNCYNLTSFTGLGNITILPNYAFYLCQNISSLSSLPTTVTTYNMHCLGYTSISDLSMIRTTDTLNSYCFANMNSLRSLATLTPRSQLPSYCFYHCNNLNTIDFTDWSSLTSIASYCFLECAGLTSIIFNDNLKNIEMNAFLSCFASNFKNIDLKNTQLTSIESYAFNYDFNLTSISLPSTLISINDYAFAGCRNVLLISCYAENAPTTYANTFGNTDVIGSYSYVGNTYKSTGNNKLYIHEPDNYRSSYWQSILLDSSKCGFNLILFDKYDIRGTKIEGLKSKYEYTGYPIIPEITVRNQDEIILVKDTDYNIQLSNNIEIGTASLSIIGINTYHHQVVETFLIYDAAVLKIEIDLNDQWRISTTKENPDPVNYDLYESYSNYNVGDAFAKMYVRTLNITDMNLYIGSYAESNYDYTVIFDPDIDVTSNPSSSTSGAKQNTSGFLKSGNDIDNDFKKVTYNLDGNTHYITICYRKDNSVNNGSDRGYLLVPKLKYPKNLADATMVGLSSLYAFTRSEIIPEVSVYSCNGTLLAENVQWSKLLKDNINVGKATISAVGIDPYYGCLEKTFTIYDSTVLIVEAILNDQWRISTTKENPDPEHYDLYESYSNYHTANAFAKMYIRTLNTTNLDLYIGSYAESTYDYTVIFDPDIDVTSNPSSSTTGAKQSTSGFLREGNDIDNDFKKVTYDLDVNEHYITICYRKDLSADSGSDRGYLLVPKFVNSKNISKGRIEGIKLTYLSSEIPINPLISVYNESNQLLEENVDWIKVLSGNTLTGTASISAVGIDPYYNYLEDTFRIIDSEPTYTELEYIESTGTQYIDCNVIESDRICINAKFYVNELTSNYLYGCSQDNNKMMYNGLYNNNTLEYNWQTISFTANDSIEMTLTISGSTITIVINGTTFSRQIGTSNKSNQYLFACKNGERLYGNLRCYYFQDVVDGNIIRDLIPVKDLDGVVCMYDKASMTFFYNQGTGDFIAGPEKNNI